MYYHVQINYFNSSLQEHTILSELNITDKNELCKDIVMPYVHGHSFKFNDTQLMLHSIHSFTVFASEGLIVSETDIASLNVVDITTQVIEEVKSLTTKAQ